ncbi:MAG: hypothetical protein ACRDHD_11775 [Candidatus Limnocylindria bacterium]
MTGKHWIAAGLIALGLVALLVAPQAQSCVRDGDATVCETGGIVILNLVGTVLASAGVAVLLTAAAHGRRNRW